MAKNLESEIQGAVEGAANTSCADALSVGDYHLATVVGRSLLGHPIDDAQMVELLEPMRPHRHRAVRLLGASGLAVYARFGPRMPIPNLAEM